MLFLLSYIGLILLRLSYSYVATRRNKKKPCFVPARVFANMLETVSGYTITWRPNYCNNPLYGLHNIQEAKCHERNSISIRKFDHWFQSIDIATYRITLHIDILRLARVYLYCLAISYLSKRLTSIHEQWHSNLGITDDIQLIDVSTMVNQSREFDKNVYYNTTK